MHCLVQRVGSLADGQARGNWSSLVLQGREYERKFVKTWMQVDRHDEHVRSWGEGVRDLTTGTPTGQTPKP